MHQPGSSLVDLTEDSGSEPEPELPRDPKKRRTSTASASGADAQQQQLIAQQQQIAQLRHQLQQQAQTASRVWVITQTDPGEQYERTARTQVLGVYSSKALAKQSLEDYLSSGDWQETGNSHIYHQGCEESRIEIHATAELDEPLGDEEEW